MDKIYSKAAMVIKAIGCILLAPVCMVLSSLINADDSFLYIIFAILPIGCLYTIPFWLTASYLKKFRVSKIGRYVIYDLVSCFLPAVFGVLCFEISYTVFQEKTLAAGLITVIVSLIFIIISLTFWLIYLIVSKKK